MLIGQKWISISVSGDSVVRIGETHPSHIAVIEDVALRLRTRARLSGAIDFLVAFCQGNHRWWINLLIPKSCHRGVELPLPPSISKRSGKVRCDH